MKRGSPSRKQQRMAMKTYSTTPAYELGELAQFLDEHPGFSPLLTGDDGILCGFRIGECVLLIAEVQALCESYAKVG